MGFKNLKDSFGFYLWLNITQELDCFMVAVENEMTKVNKITQGSLKKCVNEVKYLCLKFFFNVYTMWKHGLKLKKVIKEYT